MYRYLTISSWAAPTLAGLIVGMLIVHLITPTVVFGMSETVDDPQAQTTEESQPEEPEPTVGNTSQATEVVVTDESEAVDGEEESTPEVPTPPTETTIDTGDATAGLTLENEVNTIEVDTKTTTEESSELTEVIADETTSEDGSVPIEEEATGNEPVDPEATTETNEKDNDPPPGDPSLLSINATNSATSTTAATTSATTGDNSASGDTVTIDTGDAIAYTDVLNVVNTNIVNSDGLVKFVNDALGYQDFDLRDEFDLTFAEFDTAQSTPSCNLSGCDTADTTLINTDNTAVIDNNIVVTANTGDNRANGDSNVIRTGDAYASASVINVANTNITDSNYLLLVFNNFSDYSGDIVLPNSSFFDRVLQSGGGVQNLDLETNNSATIDNSVETVASTGGNEASGDAATITTGGASAISDVTNTVNQTIVGGSSFSMLIRVHGDWSGSITGLPDGLTWRETERGIEIVSIGDVAGPSLPSNLSQTTRNSATINNNVQVYALTGDNQASGDESTIETGNAYAGSSVLNMANTNVIGSNWSNLIFNIYGNWSGNLTFGQPNLWLGVTADSPDSPIMPGSEVTYTFTVFNHGDTSAPNVSLESIFESSALSFNAPEYQNTMGASTQTGWSLGDIGAGETREVSYTAIVNEALDRNVVSAIPLSSRVSSTQADADESDNEEVVTIYAGKKRTESSNRSSTFAAKFDIKKTASRDLAQPGDTVDYTIEFFNRGGQLFDALLVDTLENEEGEIIQQQTWPLGEIKNWETINVSYSVEFDSAMATGTYTNSAQLVGFHESRNHKYQTPYESSIATHSLGLGIMAGQVLGISDSICSPYLTEYLRYGKVNNSVEVTKLQSFLNDHLDLQIPVSGTFDLATEQGVRDFQKMYRDEVLTPWGLAQDSGYVYYTTQKKINEIMCQGMAIFPLAPTQLHEIDSYKTRMQELSNFSFNTQETRSQPSVPAAVSPVLTPAPVVRQPEKVPVLETVSVSSPEPPLLPPTPESTSNGIRSWWHSLTTGLRSVFR